METQKIKSFSIIGISLRTTNENGQSGHDIAMLKPIDDFYLQKEEPIKSCLLVPRKIILS